MFGQREFNLGLPPLSFFLMEIKVPYSPFKKGAVLDKPYLLPDMGDSASPDVYLGWSEKGISMMIDHSITADIDLFFDTRDQKESIVPTRFCHHFLFSMAEGVEISKFRIEETRPLCDPHELVVKTDSYQKKQRTSIFIPAHCLYGYDPSSFNRLGFAYRLRIEDAKPFFNLEQRPAQWSSLLLQS